MMNDMNVSFAAGTLVGILLVILFALWKKRRGTEPRYDERQVVARAKAAQLALGVLAALMLVNGFVREILQYYFNGTVPSYAIESLPETATFSYNTDTADQ